MSLFERCISQACSKDSQKAERWPRIFQRHFLVRGPLFFNRGLIVYAVAMFAASALADITCDAPISGSDVQQITRAIRGVTDKPIMFIMGVTEDKYVSGAVVTGKAYLFNVDTGEQTFQYTRTDLVFVWTEFTDREHADIYSVRKTQGRWQIEEKKHGSLP